MIPGTSRALPALSHRSLPARRGRPRRLGPPRVLVLRRNRRSRMVRAAPRRARDGLPVSENQLRRRKPPPHRIQRLGRTPRRDHLETTTQLRLMAKPISILPIWCRSCRGAMDGPRQSPARRRARALSEECSAARSRQNRDGHLRVPVDRNFELPFENVQTSSFGCECSWIDDPASKT